jgi:hypothetical protein
MLGQKIFDFYLIILENEQWPIIVSVPNHFCLVDSLLLQPLYTVFWGRKQEKPNSQGNLTRKQLTDPVTNPQYTFMQRISNDCCKYSLK